MNFIREAGFFAWPILVCAVLSAVFAFVSLQRLARGEAAEPRTATGIDGVLFWGGFSAVVGLLGTLGGVAQAARAIELAGQVSTPLVWGGLRVALHPLLMGLLAFGLALLCWYALRSRQIRGLTPN